VVVTKYYDDKMKKVHMEQIHFKDGGKEENVQNINLKAKLEEAN
jgi:hypothetical protein